MKQLKKIIGTVICLVLLLTLAQPAVDASAAYSPAAKAFKKEMSQKKIKWDKKKYKQSKFEMTRFSMGSKKTPILLVKCTAKNCTDNRVGFYQYLGGKAKKVLSANAVKAIYMQDGVVTISGNGNGCGADETYYYKLDSKGILKLCAFSGVLHKEVMGSAYKEMRKKYGDDKYQVNGKDVSASAFQSYIKKTIKQDENGYASLLFQKNTAKNRKIFFGK